LNTLARILIGGLFVFSAISKLFSMEGFELYLFSFGAAGFDLCSVVARFIVIGEFLLGTALACGIYFRTARVLAAIALSGFSLFLLWRVILGDSGSCHCMGDLIDLNPMQSLLKNLGMGLVLACCWKSRTRVFRHMNLVSALTAVAATTVVFCITPPDIYFRQGRISEDLSEERFKPVADSLGLSSGRKAICFYSASCEHCRHCASKIASIIKRHSLSPDSFPVVFMQTSEKQDSVSYAFFLEYGEELVLPNSYLHPFTFLPITNGSMPLVVLYEDGSKVKEYDYLSIDEKEIVSFITE
jgi:uncharacterized membrane protein YphA (DoxX/SURF4 family)